MARSLWKGAISFGLVTIPIELHRAVRDARPHFRMLHAKDRSPVRFERICQRENKAVPWADLVRGYEYEKGKFVVLTKEELEAAAQERSRSFDIVEFVDEEAVDDRFFDTPYYAVPGRGAERAYAVLREALRESGKLGLAKIVLHDVQHLAALGAVEDALVVTLMRFADELEDVSDLKLPPSSAVRPRELEMAKTLVAQLTEKWKPEQYEDDYRTSLMKVIRAKLKGKPIAAPPPAREQPETGVIDLMDRLKQSLDGRGRGAGARAAAPRAAARPGASRAAGARAPQKRRGKSRRVARVA
jgi:DNA end-binding protein Ku